MRRNWSGEVKIVSSDHIKKTKPALIKRALDFTISSYSYFNFAENKISRDDMLETSRTIIRAASLHSLPSLHVQSIYQVFFLGS